jgi:hypothetical protein
LFYEVKRIPVDSVAKADNGSRVQVGNNDGSSDPDFDLVIHMFYDNVIL